MFNIFKNLNFSPKYPRFREIKIQDASLIKTFTNAEVPCSDYVFSNLLNWRFPETPNKISLLNDNLVVKTVNNQGNKIVTSFIGQNKYVNTIRTLLEEEEELYYIPEFIINRVKAHITDLHIEEDRGSFDYIFDVKKILDISQVELKTKRKEINNFWNKNGYVETKLLDLSNPSIQKQIANVQDKWFKLKGIEKYGMGSIGCEHNALWRFIENSRLFNYYALGAIKGGELIGFIISEILDRDYILNPYTKGDLSYRGLFSFLTYKSAEYADSQGFKYINNECDLGIDGLRENKLGWRPVNFLKKYKIVKTKI